MSTSCREETHYVKNYIRRLREKVEKDPSSPQYILTERERGYTFAGKGSRTAVG